MPIVSSESLGLAAEKRKQEKKDKEEAQKLAKTNGGAAGDAHAAPSEGEAMEEGEKWGDEDEDSGTLEGDEWGDEVEREAKRART